MNEKLADLLFPHIDKTIGYYEKKYPERNLPDGAIVARFAPSPTGRLHMGSLFASFIPEVFASQTNGVFILRIEDTDQKRSIENGIELLLSDLKDYNYQINEDPINGGKYGPYIQTQRKEIYQTYAKYLVSIGKAYPCFCSSEEIDDIRKTQEKVKDRLGYHGKWAKCRNLSYDDVKKHIDNGDKFVIRLKSNGDFNKKIVFKDLIKGTIELPENDFDQVLLKSDGIPPYGFAHIIDDHLMRVTHITRDDSYIPSVPYHLEVWNALGFKIPKFAHLLPLCIKDGDTIRKISKRKDPEAAISFYHEKGIPTEAVKLYLATLANSNFDGWLLQNPNSSYRDFEFTFNKMSKSGPLFDYEKLINISKNYISRLSAEEVYNLALNHASIYNKDFYKILNDNKEYSIKIFNIERNQKKPRKDIAYFSDTQNQMWYMYDELFMPKNYEWQNIKDKKEIALILNTYINEYYDIKDDKDAWFNKMKQLASFLGYASDMKEYKANPEKFKGNIADISMVIRVALTSINMTPDLYEIMQLLGLVRINKRIKSALQ